MRFAIASLFLLCATQGTASVSSRIDTILASYPPVTPRAAY